MATYLDLELFIAYLKTRRGEMGLREAAQEIGEISASTLSRIENGKLPDMDVFLRLCDWMGLQPDTFLKQADDNEEKANTIEIIEAHLRADRELDPDTAEAIAKMVKSAYELNRRK